MDATDEAESNVEGIYTFILQHGRVTIDEILMAVDISPPGAYEAVKLLEEQGRVNIVYDKVIPRRIEYIEARL